MGGGRVRSGEMTPRPYPHPPRLCPGIARKPTRPVRDVEREPLDGIPKGAPRGPLVQRDRPVGLEHRVLRPHRVVEAGAAEAGVLQKAIRGQQDRTEAVRGSAPGGVSYGPSY